MKKLIAAFLLVAWTVGGVPSLMAGTNSVQITIAKKHEAGDRGTGSEGDIAKGASKVTYNITLQNGTFADLSDLTVDYVIFVERQKLGKKKDEDVVVRETESKSVALLAKNAPQIVETKEIELKKGSLVGNFHFENGGRIKVEDSVKGVWVRVSQAGKIIGEYANSATVMSRGWEAK